MRAPEDDRTRGTRPYRVWERDIVTDPFLPHGGDFSQILGWCAYWRRDLGEVIGRQFEDYLLALDGHGEGPYDLPDGAPVDDPHPPGPEWWPRPGDPSRADLGI